eukprot:gene2676-3320_t
MTTPQHIDRLIKIFEELKTKTDPNEIEDICLGIRKALESNDAIITHKEIVPYIHVGLNPAFDQEVHYTVLKQLHRYLQRKEDKLEALLWFESQNFLLEILQFVGAPSLGVAQVAMDILSILAQGRTQEYADAFTSSEFYQEFVAYFKAHKSNTTVALRILDVSGKILSIPGTLKHYKNPFLNELESLLLDTDILVSMNIVAIITQICSEGGPYSIDLVNETKIFNTFFKILSESVVNAQTISNNSRSDRGDINIDVPLVNVIIDFLGIVSSGGNPCIQSFFNVSQDDFISIFQFHLDHYDSNPISSQLLKHILATIGSIGSYESGLKILLKVPNLKKSFMELLLSNDDLSVFSMKSFYLMLKSKEKSIIISDSIYQFYQSLPEGLLCRRIMKHLQSPIQDVKVAALELIEGLCYHSWGAIDMMREPGFFEYLISRTNETTKQFKDLKYSIVTTLVNNQKDLLDNQDWKSQWNQLTLYAKLGPLYIQPEANVQIADEHQ